MRAAVAQTTTPQEVEDFRGSLPTPDAGEFFSLNIESDQAVAALRHIFGDVIDVVAGTSTNASIGAADTAFANMIGMMNAGLMFLAAVYLAWVTIVGALYTADKGEIFGQKWSVVWMPIKTTLGISAIFPVVYGYSWLQIFIFWVLLNGIGLGNSVMQKGFNMFTDNNEFTQIAPVSPHIASLGDDILRSAYCAESMNRLRNDTVIGLRRRPEGIDDETLRDIETEARRGPLMGMHGQVESNLDNFQRADAAFAAPTGGAVYQTVHYYWGMPEQLPAGSTLLGRVKAWFTLALNKDDAERNDLSRKDYCGHVKFSRVTGYFVPAIQQGWAPRWKQMHAKLVADKEEMETIIGFGDGPNVGEEELATAHRWVTALNTIGRDLARRNAKYQMSQGATKPVTTKPMTDEEVLTFIRRINTANVTYAQAREKILRDFESRNTSNTDGTLEEFYWRNFSDNLARDGFLAFGSYYVELSEARALVKKRMSTMGTYMPSDPDIWSYFQLSQKGETKLNIDGMSDEAQSDLWHYFRGYYKFNLSREMLAGVRDPDTIAPGTEGASRQALSAVSQRDEAMARVFKGEGDAGTGIIAKHAGSGFDRMTDYLVSVIERYQYVGGPPPLIRIRGMGQNFLALVGPSLGVGGALSLAGNAKIFNNALVGALAGGAEFMGGLLFTLALWLFLLGGFLAVYLPMVPFFVWVGAVVGYFLLAIESIIAAPLWAIAFMEPATQDGPGGKNAQGWYLVMNLFLRPVLLVVAMIAVMLLADVVLNYLNLYLLPAFEMSTDADTPFVKLMTFIWISIIYCVILLTTMHGVYSLIHRIPDNIMEWLGVGARGLGDLSDEREIRALVMGAIHRTPAPSSKSLGNIVQRRGPTDKPEDGAKISTRK